MLNWAYTVIFDPIQNAHMKCYTSFEGGFEDILWTNPEIQNYRMQHITICHDMT